MTMVRPRNILSVFFFRFMSQLRAYVHGGWIFTICSFLCFDYFPRKMGKRNKFLECVLWVMRVFEKIGMLWISKWTSRNIQYHLYTTINWFAVCHFWIFLRGAGADGEKRKPRPASTSSVMTPVWSFISKSQIIHCMDPNTTCMDLSR